MNFAENLNGHVALVTGGSRGIGRATCLALAARGAAVAVHYHSRADLAADVVTEIKKAGGHAVALAADVSDPAALRKLAEQANAALGTVDILVNNAGEMTDSSVEAMSDDVWDRALEVNLSSAFRLTRACLPGMRARRWGRIVNVASQVVAIGSVNHAHYSAAKSGLLGLTFSLAKEVGAEGITANLVSPGRIVTDMILDKIPKREAEWLAQTPMRRLGQPEEVAGAIAFLASDAAGYITGANLHINGGLVMG